MTGGGGSSQGAACTAALARHACILVLCCVGLVVCVGAVGPLEAGRAAADAIRLLSEVFRLVVRE